VCYGTPFEDLEPCDCWWVDDHGERLINGREDRSDYEEPRCVKVYRTAGSLSLECWAGLPIAKPELGGKKLRLHSTILPTPGGGTTDESFLGVMKANILDSYPDDIDIGKPLLGWCD
jgi:hypothetical protein